MNKKNVLILLPDSLRNSMGGIGTHFNNILKHWKYNDYYFKIIAPDNDFSDYKDKNFSYYAIKHEIFHHGLPDPIESVFLNQTLYMDRVWDIGNFDIVHSFDWSTIWAGRVIAKRFNKPLIFSIHLSIKEMLKNPTLIQKTQYDLACSLELSGVNKADAVIHVSQDYLDRFAKYDLQNKSFLIPNGIDLSEWKKKNDIILPGNRPIKVVYIGRYAAMKNVESILNADIPKEVDIIFIGSEKGGERNIYDRMLEACNEKEYFHYVGSKYGQEKVDYMMAADAVIFPSIHEPFGIVGLEALASRSILLASFVGGMKDYLTEDVAINCGVTSGSISNALKQLVLMSEEEKKRRIEGGLEICKKFSWKNSVLKLKFVYDLVLGKYRLEE